MTGLDIIDHDANELQVTVVRPGLAKKAGCGLRIYQFWIKASIGEQL
jgi:hypothetical protein